MLNSYDEDSAVRYAIMGSMGGMFLSLMDWQLTRGIVGRNRSEGISKLIAAIKRFLVGSPGAAILQDNRPLRWTTNWKLFINS